MVISIQIFLCLADQTTHHEVDCRLDDLFFSTVIENIFALPQPHNYAVDTRVNAGFQSSHWLLSYSALFYRQFEQRMCPFAHGLCNIVEAVIPGMVRTLPEIHAITMIYNVAVLTVLNVVGKYELQSLPDVLQHIGIGFLALN